MFEIERKFLLPENPFTESPEQTIHMIQGYLSRRPVLRIRKENNRYVFTYKGDGLRSRREVNLDITGSLFTSLLPLTEGPVIEKTRCRYPYQEHLIEVDLFEGPLRGLILAEVEFPDESSADDFRFPFSDAVEVTEDPFFQNSNLSAASPESVRTYCNDILGKELRK